MDIEYLLFLQQLRNGAGHAVNETICFISEVMGGAGGLAVIALVYWCLSKWAGSFMLLNFSGAYMMNQTLKNIFCISRPFIRDARLQPYVQASGYSFPSGHTMLGTAVYSSAAVWQRRRKWFVGVCAALTLMTAFGRNWIGVHTPQDVIVGMAVSGLVVAFNWFMLKWVESHPEKDVLVLAGGVVWAAALMALIPGSGKVCGIFLGALTGWFIERRWIRFETEGSVLCRALRYVLGMAVVLLLNKVLLPAVFGPLNDEIEKLLVNGLTFLTVSAGWPAVIAWAQRRGGAKKAAQ